MSPVGMLLGLTTGLALWVVVAFAPPLRRPRLDDRLAPYLHDTGSTSRLLATADTRTPFPTLERLLGPVLADAVRLLDRWAGGAAAVRSRLDRAGRTPDVDGFRAEQLAWAGAGLAVGLGFVTLTTVSGSPPQPVPASAFCALAAVAGGVARDRALTLQVRRRDARLLAELPAAADLLALAVAAGDGVVPALGRVARGDTALAQELRRVLADAHAGAGIVTALDGLAGRTGVPELARFVDGVVVALERGTPLADVLRAQVDDARAAARRALLESAGRREIAMLVPVVFLILPVVVVFALFPGFYGLRMLAP